MTELWARLVFERPQAFWGMVPIILLWLWFGHRQRQSLSWLLLNVPAPGRWRLSVHSSFSLNLHLLLLLLMAASLVTAMARPVWRGLGDVHPGGTLLLLIDGSASMWATDVPDAEGEDAQRFRHGVNLSRSLVDALPEWSFGLMTYSGVATVHLPLTPDRDLMHQALDVVEAHNFYQSTGSSLSRALQAVSETAANHPGLQVVLISDGEVPHEDDYETVLSQLAQQDVRIYTLAVGSYEGQARTIFDYNDIFAGRKPARVLQEYTTRRVDTHLQRIARATDGRFSDGALETIDDFAVQLEVRTRDVLVTVEDRAAQKDLSWLAWLAFCLGWLWERLAIGRDRPPGPRSFDLSRLGDRKRPGGGLAGFGAGAAGLARGLSVAVSVTSLLACQGGPGDLEQAHRANEKGIARDADAEHDAARPHYLRSIDFQIRSHIPTYNLARSAVLREDFPAAHDLFQQALVLEPRLLEAHFNDGIALYRWGAVVRDPKGCDLERTQTLWEQAEHRFQHAVDAGGGSRSLAEMSRRNLEAVRGALDGLEALLKQPPPACGGEGGASSSQSSAASSDSQDASQDTQGGGGGSGDSNSSDGGDSGSSGSGGQGDSGQEGSADGADGQGGDPQDGSPQDGSPQGESPQTSAPQDAPPQAGDPRAGDPPADSGEGSDSGQGQDAQGNGDDQNEGRGDDGTDAASGGEPTRPNQPPEGRGESPGGRGGPGADAGPPLSDDELQQVQQHLERIAGQGLEDGKFHRKTLAEQFPRASWRHPEETIWW